MSIYTVNTPRGNVAIYFKLGVDLIVFQRAAGGGRRPYTHTRRSETSFSQLILISRRVLWVERNYKANLRCFSTNLTCVPHTTTPNNANISKSVAVHFWSINNQLARSTNRKRWIYVRWLHGIGGRLFRRVTTWKKSLRYVKIYNFSLPLCYLPPIPSVHMLVYILSITNAYCALVYRIYYRQVCLSVLLIQIMFASSKNDVSV